MADNGLVSNASQRKYENNETIPPLAYLLRLTKAGADLNYLLHAEHVQSKNPDLFKVSCESIELAFRMTCQLSSAEDSRISSIDDASELFLGLLKQVHIANDPGVDLEALAKATAGKPRVRT